VPAPVRVRMKMNPTLPDLRCKQRTEPVPPEPYRLVADVDAPLEQNILDLSQRQRIADIHHHHEADHLGRAVEITEGIAHRRRLRIIARRLKPIYSDNAIPWEVDETKPNARHLVKEENRRTLIGPYAAAALRLLILTGARLREILNLHWEWVDLERGLLLLPDSKTGRKTIVLNAPAIAVLTALPRTGAYVIAGDNPDKPRADLNRPWRAITKRAGLVDVRIHDLRHTHASIGVGAGLGLPIIGKLLGHTQISTTARYAHLEADPVRSASEVIAGRIAAAMGEASNWEADGDLVN